MQPLEAFRYWRRGRVVETSLAELLAECSGRKAIELEAEGWLKASGGRKAGRRDPLHDVSFTSADKRFDPLSSFPRPALTDLELAPNLGRTLHRTLTPMVAAHSIEDTAPRHQQRQATWQPCGVSLHARPDCSNPEYPPSPLVVVRARGWWWAVEGDQI